MNGMRRLWCACAVVWFAACPAEETNNGGADMGVNNTTGNPAGCPNSPPATEEACATEGLACTYSLTCPCGPNEDFVWTCTNGVLTQPSLLCSTGPATSCPVEMDQGTADMPASDMGTPPADTGVDMPDEPDAPPMRLAAHGCTYETAMDQTGNATVVLTDLVAWNFDHSGICIRVDRGTVVTWNGDFTVHPLNGGVSPTEDALSPIDIAAADANGMDTVDVTLTGRGDYPYYCVAHPALMRGVIYVD